jgi:hypothetical protein
MFAMKCRFSCAKIGKMAVWQYLASTGYDGQRQASFDHGIFNGISKASREKAS